MHQNLECINRLINCFTGLGGVGYKTAERFAYEIIEKPQSFTDDFCAALKEVRANVKFCKRCGNFSVGDECDICKKRASTKNVEHPIICVVRDPRDVIAIEKSGAFRGTYHVLHGVISPLDRRGPDDINLKSLLTRMRDEKIAEVIIATNPDVTGEATANYIAALLKPCGVRVTRIAQGLAAGTNLEFADVVTLGLALNNRVQI